jgi:hypothetical protein
MSKRIILISVVCFFVLALFSCGVYEKCPGDGNAAEKTQTNV